MLPNPLHPAVVHFPLVLAILLPFFVAGAFWAIRRGSNFRRAWSIPAALAMALALSAWAAVATGEGQDNRVERVVGDQPLDRHEDLAEMFLTASAGIAFLAAGGLIRGIPGRAARILTAGASLGLVGGALLVGHSGGQLVYRYGAASAFTESATTARTGSAQQTNGRTAAADHGRR